MQKTKTNKNKLLLCAFCILILLALAVNQTFAYFTKESTTTNEVSTGYMEMALEERIKADGVTWEMLPRANDPLSIMPGQTVQQEPYVKNVESEDFYCRVSYEMFIVDKNGNPLPSDVVSVNIDPEKWVLDEEGWYRYVNVVTHKGTENDTTEPLFTEVNFSTKMDNKYVDSIITIIIDSQSVQSRYNEYDTAKGETVLDVKGFADLEAKDKGKGGTK